MYVYRNSNTGQTVERRERSVRLDALANWLLIAAPIDDAPAEDAPPAQASEATPEPGTATAGQAPIRPLDTDNKAAWVAYAVACGMPERDARTLSKAALVIEFGQEGDDDGQD